ncbi:MAG: methylmalonyl-CoA mutase family protein [Nocardioides sp.]
MTDGAGALRLASSEDEWARSDWEKAAAAVLRKSHRLADDAPDSEVWRRLARTTYDDISISPLGTPDLLDGLTTAARPTHAGGWDVRVRTSGDAATAVHDLESGATSLWLVADEVGTDLAAALDGVRLDLAAVVLESATPEQAESLVALGPLHPDSNLGATDDAEIVAFARLGLRAGVRAVVVDGTTVHEQGASDGQELGWVLARGAAVLRTLEEAGIPAQQAFGLVELRLAATDEQFPTISKLRAARRLWARMAELCDVPDPRTRIHAVTSRPMTSAFDVHVNLLRTTVAAFAAGVGGADALTVVPFDEPTSEVSALARRMARNTSALLVAESHVAAVADPAGGAYAVERLTDDLARVAWSELGAIETEGLDAFGRRVADVRSRRETDVATRRRPITGLSEYPRLADPVPGRRNLTYRWGAAFEALRREPPTAHVFLATLGTVAAHTARAGFATNLLGAGGIGVDVAGATGGVDDLVAAYAGQGVVCLAGTDAAYAEWGREAAEALRAQGATRVVVAGKPAEWADDSCALGVDAIDFLTRTREAL